MEFICANCQNIFIKQRFDIEVEKEKDYLFPEAEKKDLVLVCEPCFIKIMDFNEPSLKRYTPFINKE